MLKRIFNINLHCNTVFFDFSLKFISTTFSYESNIQINLDTYNFIRIDSFLKNPENSEMIYYS
mgnify:CR=1 FL=1